MLNRHAIVLFLGSEALLTIVRASPITYALTGVAFLVLVLGLLLDSGQPGARANAAHALQAIGIAVAVAAAVSAASRSWSLALALVGIAVAVFGVLFEMVVGYGAVRLGVATQAVGDALYVAGFGAALLTRTRAPSIRGWVFIALVGAISIFAALYNLQLQLRRLRNLQAGWRYQVLSAAGTGLRLKTPSGEAQISWHHVHRVERLDGRHLILVLPAPLPPELARSGLPLDELRRDAVEAGGPDHYGFILHEQEIGCALPAAEQDFRRFVAHATCAQP